MIVNRIPLNGAFCHIYGKHRVAGNLELKWALWVYIDVKRVSYVLRGSLQNAHETEAAPVRKHQQPAVIDVPDLYQRLANPQVSLYYRHASPFYKFLAIKHNTFQRKQILQ
jgi:hypothetical protein